MTLSEFGMSASSSTIDRRPLRGVRQQIGLAHFAADQPRDLADRVSRSPCAAVRHAADRRLDMHERQEVLRPHGALQLVVEHEVERFGGQHAEILVKEGVGSHDALSSSASLIL